MIFMGEFYHCDNNTLREGPSIVRRLARRAADEVRAGHQSENSQADRISYPTERFSQSRQSNPMSEQSKIGNPKSKMAR
jgi:hypothetical protein